MAKDEDVFIYVGKDKTKWHKLDSILAKEFRENKIAYLRDPVRIRALRTQPAPTAHIPFPPNETENQREERKRRQDREDRLFASANERWIKDLRTIQQDFSIAITIIQKHVSEAINMDLQAVLVAQELIGATEEAKYNSIYNRLAFKYGPYDQKDVENLRDTLLNLDLDKGVREAILLFNNTIMSMTLTYKRDGNNNILRANVEPILPADLPHDATNEQIIEHWQQTENAKADVIGIEGPALNHRPTDEELKTYIKRALNRTTLSYFKNIFVESIKPQNAHWTFQQIMQQIDTLIDHESEGIQLQATRNAFNQMSVTTMLPDKDHYNAEKSYERTYYPGIYYNRNDQGRSSGPGAPGGPGGTERCMNCGQRGHRAFICPSLKCGQCDGQFDSVEDRRDHYKKWHGNINRRSDSPYPSRGRDNREFRDRSRSRSRERTTSRYNRERSRSRSESLGRVHGSSEEKRRGNSSPGRSNSQRRERSNSTDGNNNGHSRGMDRRQN